MSVKKSKKSIEQIKQQKVEKILNSNQTNQIKGGGGMTVIIQPRSEETGG